MKLYLRLGVSYWFFYRIQNQYHMYLILNDKVRTNHTGKWFRPSKAGALQTYSKEDDFLELQSKLLNEMYDY